MTSNKHQCAGMRSDPPWYLRKYPCTFNATFSENGQWWCGIHAPSKVKARKEKRDQEWKAKGAAVKAENQRRADRYTEDARKLAAFDQLLEALKGWVELWNMRPIDSGADMQEILARCWHKTELALDKAEGKP